ncbi:ATP-binding protein [Kitasatospora sp. NPDC057015]|uniref:ATP-binding protein n=1 Tax=Kitasatospora sp. NPDC057015 TaxID=3346001 RepID=UPI003643C4B4
MPRILTAPRTHSAPGGPGGPPRIHRYELAADGLTPSRLRRWIAGRLTDWQVPHLVDDLTLIASELATNAVRHGGTSALATLSISESDAAPRVVRLEIQDSGPGFDPDACLRAVDHPDATERCGGRGLLLVAALSSAWGASHTGAGQLVWAEMAAH